MKYRLDRLHRRMFRKDWRFYLLVGIWLTIGSVFVTSI
jgi:hypothetical protein